MDPKVPIPTIPVSSSIVVLRCSGRVVIQPSKFMYFIDFLKIIPEEHRGT